jgi:hypothetical protein
VTDRAALVEAAALEALRKAEGLEEELLAESVRFAQADNLLAERDRALLAGVAERWVRDNLGDVSIMLGPSVAEYVASVRDAAYVAATNANVIRTEDWKASNYKRDKLPMHEFGGGLPPYLRMAYRASGDLGWYSRADYEASLEAAAEEQADAAERALRVGLCLQAATKVTAQLGFDFWQDHYIEIEIVDTSPSLKWETVIHEREVAKDAEGK